jgi:hypothetical protein
MDTVEEFEHNGYTVKIIQDEDAESPRDWDNACTMVCFHGRYQLGDKDHGYNESDYNGWDELYDAIVRDHKPVAIFPLGLIDHSGISMYVGSGAHWCDPGGWDSGQVGFAFVSRAKGLEEWGKSKVTKHVRDMAEKCLRAEVETYDQYLRGDVYGYVVETPDGEQVDSCWGFFGLEYCKAEAIGNVPSEPALQGGESEDEAHEETLVG